MATAHKPPDGRRTKGAFELVRHYARLKRRRSVIEMRAPRPDPKAGPLPDEPEFNEETKQALRESMAGEGLVRHDSLEDFFAAHGL